MTLSGKRILFIAPMFFGYEKLIKEELKRKGALVDYFNDRPDNSFLTKSLVRIDRRLLAKKTNRYYENIIKVTSDHLYDYILIVRGEAISQPMLRNLRQAQPQARLCLYLWDSMYYNPNARNILNEFDCAFSFDRSDVKNNPKLEFLPLFYGRDFDRSASCTGSHTYDACFIGTIHTDRYKVLEKILDDLKSRERSVFVFCYYPSRILYRLRAFIDPGFRRFGKKYVSFVGMKLSDVVDKIADSNAVIDVNRPDQLGLTMRSLEAVGAQRKLITTNADIVNYDIYDPNAVLVVDRNSPYIDDAFLTENGLPFSTEIRNKYSVSAWVDRIFQ
ncbi:hypothetical protein [Pectobacterium brasiliense]|uniref:hypothetical protein n=1 Tax=Pectobacterium brasiliense TaxID=180957 RepID=UPI00057CFF8C|nr:hypothetical protein [Pectobacterium brasiliense]KHT39448.1 hypothetical protein RD02_17025 [Pectobacterium brasiliense]